MKDWQPALGEHVLAATNGTGRLLPGVVTGWMDVPQGLRQYVVRFDGSSGDSMPCAVAYVAPEPVSALG